MGIRFACHLCGKKLNIKRELAGKRGVCPSCSNRFRIPWEDSDKSIPLETALNVGAAEVETSSSAATITAGTQMATVGSAVDIGGDLEVGGALDLGEQPDLHSTTDPVRDTPSSELVEEVFADTPTSVRPSDLPSSLLDEDPAATWYVRPPSGGQYGPASSEILREWIAQGRVAATALIWRDGWPQWREASETLPELADRLPSGTVVSRSAAAISINDNASAVSTSPSTSSAAAAGTDRRSQAKRRALLISALATVAVALIGLLIFAANQ